MQLDDFDFELPARLIAQRPVQPRDAARLLEVRADGVADRGVRDLPGLLRAGDHLVFNDTRVIPARLVGRRDAVRVELLLHRADPAGGWWAFARPGKRLRPGQRIIFADDFSATVQAKAASGEILVTLDAPGGEVAAALRRHAAIPLPPYIRGGLADARDAEDYQTLFAAHDGAVAAPTAALHFTDALMAGLTAAGIGWSFLTLHVGAGTFLPVKTEDPRAHRMHAEQGTIGEATADRLNAVRAAGGRLIAVGTTSLRLLESAADADGLLRPFAGETDIFILPGYRFRAVDLLMTNFHLPRSTLFMLVAAFAGLGRMQAAYAHARAAEYRFYSYGDACLLHPTI